MVARMEVGNDLRPNPRELGVQNTQPESRDSIDPQLLLPRGETTSFRGRTRLYTIRMFRSGSEHGFVTRIDEDNFKLNPELVPLVKTVDDLYQRVYPERTKRNPELTTKRILKSLSNPRTLLYLILHEGVAVGYGIFPRLDSDGESIFYSSRAILPEHVQEGAGTHILELGIRRHRKETTRLSRPLHDGFLMTQRWESIRSLEKLRDRGIIGKIQPIEEPFDERGVGLLYVVHAQVRVNSTGIDRTGRSRGELSEVGYNENLGAPRAGTKAEDIFNRITSNPPRGAGVNPFNGDVLYVRFTIPQQLPPVEGEISTGN